MKTVVAVLLAIAVYYTTNPIGPRISLGLGVATVLIVILGPQVVRGFREGFQKGKGEKEFLQNRKIDE